MSELSREKIAQAAKIAQAEDENDESTYNILDEPLHGIYIPSGLFLAGIAILYTLSKDKRILYAVPAFFVFIMYNILRASKNLKSVFADKWSSLELVDKTLISKNSAIYTFALKSKVDSLNFPVGHHIGVKVNIDGKDEIRFYSPVSPQDQQGTFDIIVKSYGNGKVSKWFATESYTGMKVDFKGPVGRFNYKPCKEIGMIAGGSGITPMLQVISKIVMDPKDSSKISLIYANETENDILLKDELDEMAEKYPNFKVKYVVNKPKFANVWNGETGLVTKEMMKTFLPRCFNGSRLLICGKPEMKQMLLDYAQELGWPKGIMKSDGDDQVFVF